MNADRRVIELLFRNSIRMSVRLLRSQGAGVDEACKLDYTTPFRSQDGIEAGTGRDLRAGLFKFQVLAYTGFVNYVGNARREAGRGRGCLHRGRSHITLLTTISATRASLTAGKQKQRSQPEQVGSASRWFVRAI